MKWCSPNIFMVYGDPGALMILEHRLGPGKAVGGLNTSVHRGANLVLCD